MKNNPIPLKTKSKVVCEDGAKPKPHERIAARALADVDQSSIIYVKLLTNYGACAII